MLYLYCTGTLLVAHEGLGLDFCITFDMLHILIVVEAVPVAQWLEHCVSTAKVVGLIPREHTY